MSTMLNEIKLVVSEDDKTVGYIYLPNHPGKGQSGVSNKIIRLHDLIKYKGPDIIFDFDKDNNIIGIEIID